MNKFVIFTLLFFTHNFLSSQNDKNAVYVKFNETYEEMIKVDFTNLQTTDSTNQNKKSITYLIESSDSVSGYPNKLKFNHVNLRMKDYEHFGGKAPSVDSKSIKFLDSICSYDISYFRKTPQNEVIDRFEKDDIIIYIIDETEQRSDSITLREVYFIKPIIE